MAKTEFATIDEYIASFPTEVQKVLEQVRKVIKEVAPAAEETISYAIPTYKLNKKYLVYFAAHSQHIGLYPFLQNKIEYKQFDPYKAGKGTLQFALNKPLPLEVIQSFIELRLRENEATATANKTKRTCENGHTYYKTSDCSTCPICEQETKPSDGQFSKIAAPARRALQSKGITTASQLAKYSKKEVLSLHGMGKAALQTLEQILEENKLKFKQE